MVVSPNIAGNFESGSPDAGNSVSGNSDSESVDFGPLNIIPRITDDMGPKGVTRAFNVKSANLGSDLSSDLNAARSKGFEETRTRSWVQSPRHSGLGPIKSNSEFLRSAFFTLFFVIVLVLLGLGTFFSFSRQDGQLQTAYDLLRVNAALILLLAVYLAYRIRITLFANNARPSAPFLHRRFVLIFSLAALIPALVIGAFSTSLIRQNISNIFGSDVRENMAEASIVLNDYVEQAFSKLTGDMNTLKVALETNYDDLQARISYSAELGRFARIRDLDAVYVMRSDGVVLSRAESANAPRLLIPRPDVFVGLKDGNIALQKHESRNFLIAMTQLEQYDNAYLYIGQRLRSDSQILSSISGIETATQKITKFNKNQNLRKNLFLLTFFETAMLILMISIGVGMLVANRIINPLSGLINAAERVRGGDMSARVNVSQNWGEISDLGSAFNRMTQQLNAQREALIREHDLSEQSRQFSEAVLSAVRAGVIGLGQTGKIALLNESAKQLLGRRADAIIGQPLDRVLPEFMPAFTKAREALDSSAEDQITIPIESMDRNFDLHVSAYNGVDLDAGWVMTFDDMTRLVSAQRHSAWREVARRIAHEIKNPLTPIQLSAERLQRKYGGKIFNDDTVFHNCTQTILRQVNSLEQMVNEFSAFARMPAPELAQVNIHQLMHNMLFEEGVSFPDITFTRKGVIPEDLCMRGDERLLMQALTNIYKNAGEAVMRYVDEDGDQIRRGMIITQVQQDQDWLEISIIDNGPGWPLLNKHKLLEPYVTTRESGTGLGLTIVNRIIEDHGGTLILSDRNDGKNGAIVTLKLPILPQSVLTQPVLTQPVSKQQGDSAFTGISALKADFP